MNNTQITHLSEKEIDKIILLCEPLLENSKKINKKIFFDDFTEQGITSRTIIRKCIYNFYDEYFIEEDAKNGDTKKFVRFHFSTDKRSVIYLSYLILNEKMNDFLNQVIALLKKEKLLKEITKCKIILNLEDRYYSYWKKIFFANGFLSEGVKGNREILYFLI